MIIADSFCQSDLARRNEFTTTKDDTPLIVQFAAKDPIELLTAAELVVPYADGVDLNCGCPQRWAISSGYGCATLKDPQLLHDIVTTVKRNLPAQFTVSVKLRLLRKDDNYATTIELCRMVEKCRASFVSLHGRTPWEKSCDPADMDGIAQINQSLQIPVIANGDIRNCQDADNVFIQTQCAGVMVARGLLANPSLFTGTSSTPLACITDWLTLADYAGDHISFQCFHHHLTFMTEKLMSRKQRVLFNNLTKKQDVIDFLWEHLDLATVTRTCDDCMLWGLSLRKPIECEYDEKLYNTRRKQGDNCSVSLSTTSTTQHTSGKFFDEYLTKDSCDDREQLCCIGDKSIFD